MPNVNKMSDHPELLKQLALEVIAGIPLDAAKIYSDGSKGETNTTGGSGVLIELPGHVIKLQKRNADHASVFRTELIAIMCGLSFINNIRDLAVSEIWILTDSRSSIQHLSNWPFIGDSTSRSILHLFQQLSDRHPIHLQRVPSHAGLLGSEVADDLAKAATNKSMWIRKTTWSLHRLRSTPGLKNYYVEPG
ncbi:RNase H domain-containing protein [Trichonephila clavipes]|nr:RNase H domain-containing protein [Trichonephila clavipes]